MLRNILRLPRPFGSFLLVAAATTLSPVCQAQNASSTNNEAPPQPSNQFTAFKNFFHPQTSISLGTFAQLTPTRIDGTATSLFTTNGISPTPGIIGTFRQQFRPWFGYSLNLGYTRVAERYTGNEQFYDTNGYDYAGSAHMAEMSLSYIARKQLTRRMSGFLEVGAGKIAFVPINSNHEVIPLNPNIPRFYGISTYRPEGVAGFGLQFHLANSFGLRVGYRGLLYKNPTFGTGPDLTTVSSEPTVSLTYSFGHK